jgi:hypothetical protein
LIPSTRDFFQTWVLEYRNHLLFETLEEGCLKSFEKGEGEITKVLTSLLGDRILTIRDAFMEERKVIFQKLIEKELNEHRQVYADLFDKTKQAVEALAREGLEIPYEIRVAAEVALSDRLLRQVKELKRDLKETIKRGEVDHIVDQARQHGYQLKIEEPILILSGILKEKMEGLQKMMNMDVSSQSERIQEILTLLDVAEKWGFGFSKEEAQNIMAEILGRYAEGLEESWWMNGGEKPFSPNLINLAERLGFNIDRFPKMTKVSDPP